MSSSKQPADNSHLQLPSWDEFDAAEEPDNNVFEHENDDGFEQPHAKNFCPALPPSMLSCKIHHSLICQFF